MPALSYNRVAPGRLSNQANLGQAIKGALNYLCGTQVVITHFLLYILNKFSLQLYLKTQLYNLRLYKLFYYFVFQHRFLKLLNYYRNLVVYRRSIYTAVIAFLGQLYLLIIQPIEYRLRYIYIFLFALNRHRSIL